MALLNGRLQRRPQALVPKLPARPCNSTAVRRTARVISIGLVVLPLCLGCLSMPALGQTDVNDVHVATRTVEKASTEEVAKQSLVAPSLTAHVRPWKVANDLVLVPETITEQTDRLVTDLEKDNFQQIEGSSNEE